MAEEETHLSQMLTQWTLLRQAHTPGEAGPAQEQLLTRYYPAVYRFLRKLLGDEDAAQELGQEFAVRFLRGDFRHAQPERGRFRDYLKASLRHLTAAHRKVVPLTHVESLPGLPLAAPEPEDDWPQFWRKELLNRAWAELEGESGTSLRYEVLRLKSDEPTLDSAALAERLTAQHDRPFTAVGVRQLLHRARERFGALLRAEVAATVPGGDADAELGELGLLVYC